MAKSQRRRKAAGKRPQPGIEIIKVEVIHGGAGYPVLPMVTLSPGYPLTPAATASGGGASSGTPGASQVWALAPQGEDGKTLPPPVPAGKGKTKTRPKRQSPAGGKTKARSKGQAPARPRSRR